MSLSEDLKTIIQNHGVDILSNPQVINYFSDLGISGKYPYAIPIFKDLLSQHGTEIVSTYKSEDKSSLNNLLRKIQNKYISASIYNEKRILEIFDSLAFSLDTQINTSPSHSQSADAAEKNDELTGNIDKRNVPLLPNNIAEHDDIFNRFEIKVESLKKLRQDIPQMIMTEEAITGLNEVKLLCSNIHF